MKRYSLIAWIAIGLLVFTTVSTAAGSQPLDIQVIPHSRAGKVSSSVITVTIRNISNIPLYLPKVLTPIFTPDHHLQNSLFDVVDSTGKPAPFIGRYVHVIATDPDTYYLKLSPGETATHDLDLAVDYDLSEGGEFIVSYDQPYSTEILMSPRGDIASVEDRMPSEVARIWVEGLADSVSLSSTTAFVKPFGVTSDSPCLHGCDPLRGQRARQEGFR